MGASHNALVIRTVSSADLPALREFLTRANDSPYDLAAVAEEKCFGDGIAGTPATRVFVQNGNIAGVAVTCGKWLRILAVDPGGRRQGIGTALLGEESVVFAEPGNYLTPGVLMENEGTRAFFRRRGFKEAQSTWNLEVELEGISPEAEATRPSHADAVRVLSFVEREFGRIWRFEAAKAFEREVPPAFITEERGEITGFAVHDVNNRGLGFFGPTGVSKSMRGKGVGCRLLMSSLADMRRMGYARAVIPWTDAREFYRKSCGAVPAHRFVTMQRR